MRGEIVAVDLETTGFDPSTEKIIEIGAVRMIDGEIVEEFSTLINPERSIPMTITHLTGIRNEDVLDAPSIQSVLPRLKAFVGNSAWMAHNISFDASFLNKLGILQSNPRIDTYELASVLLPRAPRYTLTALTSDFGVDIESAHRALYDARATARLYWQLWNKLMQVPLATVREIYDLSSDLAWDGRIVFGAALQERANEKAPPSPSITELFANTQQPQPVESVDVKSEKTQNTSTDIDTFLGESGKFSSAISNYEYRPQQLKMAQKVMNALNTKNHLIVEAGTGTGKSIAYLLPAVLWAIEHHEPVVISTNTINLQEQLLNNDIPLVSAALNRPINAVILKGRGNYLCPRRLAIARRRRPTNVEELRMISKILVWLLESQTGDKSEISLRGPEENLMWQRLSAEDEGCTVERCSAAMVGACPFCRARQAAEKAEIIIVNHALLVSDAMTENNVIPDYRALIIDEAHHLEDATTGGLSYRIDEGTLRRRLGDLGNTRRGLLGAILNAVRTSAPEKDVRKIENGITAIAQATLVTESHVTALFNAMRSLVADVHNSPSDYLVQIRVNHAMRSRSSFAQAQSAWHMLAEFFAAISDAMPKLIMALNKLESFNIPHYADLVSSAETVSRYLAETQTQMGSFFEAPSKNGIYWISSGQDSDYVGLNSAPLHVGALIEQYLLNAKQSVIFTSATLQTNRSFDFLRQRLNLEGVEALEVGSPFDYKKSTLIFVPTDMPEPNDRNKFQQSIERGIIELAAALNGRVMALFTSYSQLRQTAQAITPRLALGNIAVFDQSDGSSRQSLLEGFKNSERGVLLGTRSFWEGVDLPGQVLSALVIVRLPFTVPTDPVFAARAETYSNSFNDYTLPDAILRFRQGFGRLIRTQNDRGVVAVFDNRIVTKNYGANFIEALPDANVEYAPLASLPASAAAWLKPTEFVP